MRSQFSYTPIPQLCSCALGRVAVCFGGAVSLVRRYVLPFGALTRVSPCDDVFSQQENPSRAADSIKVENSFDFPRTILRGVVQ